MLQSVLVLRNCSATDFILNFLHSNVGFLFSDKYGLGRYYFTYNQQAQSLFSYSLRPPPLILSHLLLLFIFVTTDLFLSVSYSALSPPIAIDVLQSNYYTGCLKHRQR